LNLVLPLCLLVCLPECDSKPKIGDHRSAKYTVYLGT
jgi:hypothetical protein